MFINKFKNLSYNFFIRKQDLYSERYNNFLNNKFNFTTLANIFVKNYTFDINLLLDYLKKITKTNNKIYKTLEKINSNYFQKNLKKELLCTYGIDEYFINKYLVNLIERDNVFFIIEYPPFIYFVKKMFINTDKYDKIIKELLIKIIKTYYNNINTSWPINKLINFISYSSNLKYPNEINKLYYKNYVFNDYINNMKKIKEIIYTYYKKHHYIYDKKYFDQFNNVNFKYMDYLLLSNIDILPSNFVNQFII